ncbi:hypothetical protein EEI45_07360 [Erysipelothrix piscisicarius]|uniref:Uncharacterized protein n=1 Tax=Erysipelothrix piscisicarius TaxID=2485784 RepID=A0A3S8RNX2_9FIRM|nr:hypothetical protein [Erysipelothrix piscisicarius]AZK44569.1 hypothetical protein EEI45_07360 [Erysipelothrix piscisicarius]
MKYKNNVSRSCGCGCFGIMIQVMIPGTDLLITKPNTFSLSKRLETQNFHLNCVLIRNGRVIENKVLMNQNHLQVENEDEIRLKTIQFELLKNMMVLSFEMANKQLVSAEKQIEMVLPEHSFQFTDGLETVEFGETYLLAYASSSIYTNTVTLSDLYAQITNDKNTDEFIVFTIQFQ